MNHIKVTDMSNTHEALKLADDIKGSGQFSPLKTLDDAEAMLRTQHALIVQMAEALEAALEGNEYRSLQGEWAWHSKQMPSNAALDKARDSHVAATQYLKGQQ